jgi:hypothetical protein
MTQNMFCNNIAISDILNWLVNEHCRNVILQIQQRNVLRFPCDVRIHIQYWLKACC